MPTTPDSPRSNAHLEDRAADELIGLARMALCDGVLDPHEVEFLYRWFGANPGALERWPGRDLWPAVVSYISNADPQAPDSSNPAEGRLLGLLAELIGNAAPEDHFAPTGLPLTTPPPAITFAARNFCFTGESAYGSRSELAAMIQARGGSAESNVTMRTHYLVICGMGSESWRHSAYGRKIEKAANLRDRPGSHIAIITDDWLIGFLRSP